MNLVFPVRNPAPNAMAAISPTCVALNFLLISERIGLRFETIPICVFDRILAIPKFDFALMPVIPTFPILPIGLPCSISLFRMFERNSCE